MSPIEHMIDVPIGGWHFKYRVAGVAVHDGSVLVQKEERDDFWCLPGGRVEIGETSAIAVEREMQEEIGCEVSLDRLLWVVENFYRFRETNCHEITMYYLINILDSSVLDQETFSGDDDGFHLVFHWIPIEQIKDLDLYPTFLRTALTSLPDSIEHIVHHGFTTTPSF